MKPLPMNESYSALAGFLRRVDFFAPLTVGQMEKMVHSISCFECEAGEAVFKQGAKGDAFYIIYLGKVEVRIKKGFFSAPKRVATLQAGDFFGEMALLTTDPRTATIVAIEPTKLFVLLRRDFHAFLGEHPGFAQEVQKAAAHRKFVMTHGYL